VLLNVRRMNTLVILDPARSARQNAQKVVEMVPTAISALMKSANTAANSTKTIFAKLVSMRPQKLTAIVRVVQVPRTTQIHTFVKAHVILAV